MYKSELQQLLKQHFGFDEFRPYQEEIVNHIVDQKDTFVLMPTGGGKSLCYQLPALYFSGLTVVISPLIALMKDQVDALKLNGIQAELINSSLSANDIENVKHRAKQGQLKLLYVAPERLSQAGFTEFLKNLNLSLIAVDEAHCISEWGHDFRPDYRNLSQLKVLFPNIPLVALTATATPKVQQDIITQLRLSNGRSFTSSFDRPNLKFSILQKKDTFSKLLYFMEKYKGESVIIYCFSRKDTESLASQLQQAGYKASPYHAGLSPEQRKATQDQFIRDDLQIITATIAFGMGIDKSNIRLVVHYNFPKSIEGYYQEVGRAGRDGLPSECVTFFGYQDRFNQQFFIDQITDPVLKRNAQAKLQQVMDYCTLNRCRRASLLDYFGQKSTQTNCQNCDNCTGNQDALFLQNISARSHPKTSRQEKKAQLPFHSACFENLRILRKKLADQNAVPPYVIFSDATLQEMAYYLPNSLENFGNIQGVGAQKTERFGELFTKEIQAFIRRTGHNPIAIPNRTARQSHSTGKAMVNQYPLTQKMLQEKKSIAEIAQVQGFQGLTITNHIERLLEIGVGLDLEYLKPPQDRFEVMEMAFKQCGDERLKPVFESLSERYSYDELRLVRLILRARGITKS